LQNAASTLSPNAITELLHELRSPLGGFESMLALLRETPLDAHQRDILAAMDASARHLRALMAPVLPEHPADDAKDITAKDIPLKSFADQLALSVDARARVKGLASRFDYAPSLHALPVFDGKALRQVMENLIDNAVRATSTGGIAIGIAPSPRPGWLQVSIRDSRPGLPGSVMRLLQGQESEPQTGGFGLKISQRLVRGHGGVLQAQSNPDGPGTTFSFDWPIAPERSAPRGEALIVDDHLASRLVIRTIVSALGFTCREADGVGTADALLTQSPFSLVLTDLRMGEGGGAALLQSLAAKAGHSRPKILVVSADSPADHPDLRGLHNGFVQKPMSVQGLVEALRCFDQPIVASRTAA
jgi:CheY-like chemotaxis protein